MTQITSAVDLCNLSLGHLKIAPITSLSGSSTEEKICNLYYDITRQAVLESNNWAFAMKRVALAEDSGTPAFGWEYQSDTMPADFLKLVGLYDECGEIYINTNNQYYGFENGRILTDISAPYYVKYIADITDVAKFDRLFTMNFSFALATTMSEALKVSSTLLQVITDKWQSLWKVDALAVNGQQVGIIRVKQSNFLNSRRV